MVAEAETHCRAEELRRAVDSRNEFDSVATS